MNEPRNVLRDGTKILTNDYLSSTAGINVKHQHLSARKPKTPGIIRGWVAGCGGDVYWVQHEGEEIAAVYGFTEFQLTEMADIEENRTPLEYAVRALLTIVQAHTPQDMVLAAAKALAKMGVQLPPETPPAVMEFYEAAKK